ncbi:uncharacterized protein LOC123430494 [Hordeum vulgare subsp. vulgare]|uniref:uncharacterized protein LOC123430494 n=1 Tax=Hordeum vulgare subsp. vulgare TaxID=112509 RepID=UPI001D1A5723|nr:uncharacterized protein LOC123430494 [Hordeum vulgare subsp. vulgare]XP_044970297.1 uncharacterized protein LOC123430494 [Hordeum vulgare subsp. vulgare]
MAMLMKEERAVDDAPGYPKAYARLCRAGVGGGALGAFLPYALQPHEAAAVLHHPCLSTIAILRTPPPPADLEQTCSSTPPPSSTTPSPRQVSTTTSSRPKGRCRPPATSTSSRSKHYNKDSWSPRHPRRRRPEIQQILAS